MYESSNITHELAASAHHSTRTTPSPRRDCSSMNTQRLLAESSMSGMSGCSQSESALQPFGPMPALPQRKKKPGPKRDSKPAPSEKLERNRQAQRTHRERKEQYTKELELEVMRLKELFAQAAQERHEAIGERDQLRAENQRLREHMQPAHSYAGTDSGYESLSGKCDATSTTSFSDTSGCPRPTANHALLQEVKPRLMTVAAAHQPRASMWEVAETRGFASDGPIFDLARIKLESSSSSSSPPPLMEESKDSVQVVAKLTTELPAITLDYDELGLDFILTLERPCMNHIHYLHVRAHNPQTTQDHESPNPPLEVPDDGLNQHISGHALMATAPLYTAIMAHPGSRSPCRMPRLPRGDLLRLLNLSLTLEIAEPEVPPVRAWIRLMQDRRVRAFSGSDWEVLKGGLLGKVNCYRFGAVIDQHDIDDALTQVCQAKEAVAVAAASPGGRGVKLEP